MVDNYYNCFLDCIFDIGLGNGLRNKLAESIACKDEINARKYVSTTYGAMGILCFLFFIIEACIVPFCNWNSLLNAHSIPNGELTLLMLWVLSSLAFQMLLKLLKFCIVRFTKAGIILIDIDA